MDKQQNKFRSAARFVTSIWLLAVTWTAAPCAAIGQTPPSSIRFENDHVRLELGANGQCISFTDRHTGHDWCKRSPGAPFARVKKGARLIDAASVALTDSGIEIGFGEQDVRVELEIVVKPEYMTVQVMSVAGEGIEELVFVDVPLTLRGVAGETFAACAIALNLQTNVREVPRPTGRLEAICYPRFGFDGACVALIGCPPDRLRGVMQQAVSAAPDLPHSPVGGPWALDAEINRGSYLFNFGNLSEETADDWIKLAKGLGMTQIDFHGGSSFRFGDCEPNPKTYPNGRASLRRVIDRLHAAGIKAGLHTYAFFIDKKCPWVTPVPDRRLAADARFTLAESLEPDTARVFVSEPTTNMSAVTGFFVRNSATLRIEDELIVYTGVDAASSYAFTGCQRGACGTRAAPHPKGTPVHHLKECFGLFVPDGDSTFLSEVAARTAATFNECGFDMMYLDALDGEDILGGAHNSWHYGSKFVFELWKRLDRPALVEMSTFHHHLWCVRSRLGAWDHPTRSHKKFIDVHCAANDEAQGMFLPMHLGWWAIKTWTDQQGEPTFADDIEYLCCKALATDTSFSLMGVDPAGFSKNPALRRLGAITSQYEELRHAKHFSEQIKQRLRVPGKEFTLDREPAGGWMFRPVQQIKHKVESLEDWTCRWRVMNQFGGQPLTTRIEALMAAEPYDSTNSAMVAEFKVGDEFADHAAAPGVTADLRPASDQVKTGTSSGRFTATNSNTVSNGTWARASQWFEKPIDLSKNQALGLWVRGDGRGEVLNVQLQCPSHVVAGIGEHYVVVDFTGWRYFELIEPEGERYADYAWPYGNPYAIYRETVDYGQINQIGLWLNNLPPRGQVACHLSTIRAIPLVKSKLRNPRLTVGNRTVVLPVELETGCYIELNSLADCKLYGPDGTELQQVTPAGELPLLAPGENSVAFACDPLPLVRPRARVTITTVGPPLKE